MIAVLDDEAKMRTALRRLLQLHGYRVALFESGAELLATYPTASFACILLDLHMPEVNGFTVLEKLAGSAAPPPVIVVTGHDQPGIAEHVRRLGARAHLTKPVDEGTLLHAIRSALEPGEPADTSPNGN